MLKNDPISGVYFQYQICEALNKLRIKQLIMTISLSVSQITWLMKCLSYLMESQGYNETLNILNKLQVPLLGISSMFTI